MNTQFVGLWRLFSQAVTVCAAIAVVVTVFLRVNDDAPSSYSDAIAKVLPTIVSLYGKGEGGADSNIGAGVIVSEEGYILTNYHLVANIESIEIGLQSGESYAARLVGIAPDIDIAVLHISAPDLSAIHAATRARLEPGDIVFAVGNPFGLNRSTTMGIVSAIGRNKLGLHGFEQFIQTDAAINPGSSGGALTDAEGNLVGINNALFYRRSGVRPQGIGFAIPVGLAMRSYERLIDDTAPAAGTVGVEARGLSLRLRSEVMSGGRAADGGFLLVTRVWRGHAGARNGVRVGDIITKINGAPPGHDHILDDQLLASANKVEILRGDDALVINLND